MFNLVVVLFLTFAMAAVLIYFISAHDRRHKKKMDALAALQDGPEVRTLDFRQFSKICMDLCEHLKLEVTDVAQPMASEIAIRAVSDHPVTRVEYLVSAFHLPRTAVLEIPKILELSDQIVSERVSKAIVITTGRIDPQVRTLPELAPMEFIDGQRLMGMMEEYKINY